MCFAESCVTGMLFLTIAHSKEHMNVIADLKKNQNIKKKIEKKGKKGWQDSSCFNLLKNVIIALKNPHRSEHSTKEVGERFSLTMDR